MKKFSLYLCLIVAVCFITQSCVKDTLQTTYTYYLPVYKSKTEVLQSIKSAPPQQLKKTGKLFLFGQYIFINEINKGVHIIDNTNPLAPKNISFIAIPGNLDIAVKNTTLYADLFTDMVTIDIADPANIVLKKVNSGVFPERVYDNGFVPDSNQYIIDWVKHETTDKTEFEVNKSLGQPLVWFSSTIQTRNTTAGAAVVGVGGSMARFTVVNNYLYTVGRFNLTAFNIISPTNPVMENVRSLGWNIETIYPLKDKLFIGSQTGMFIYSIAVPSNPSFLGSFSHACFRDPVIADDKYAYVTLRATTDESPCWGAVAAQRNELDIVNISNILQPSLVKIYDMSEPQGLSKDGDHLFICDGKGGLKIYNAANVQDLKLLKVISNINPFDVICQAGIAIVVAGEGIFQYDYTNINNIKLISKITIDK
ncbi:MAG: hypothetical protein H7Z13_19390 [Ferruginibacter sp.]|nr:hypothetical protein [Ferruginibacter sp.]